jgi:hypothetical protein
MNHIFQAFILPLLIMVGGGNPEESIDTLSGKTVDTAVVKIGVTHAAPESLTVHVNSIAAQTEIAPVAPESLKITIDSVVTKPAKAQTPIDSSWWSRNISNKAFGVGERLEFSVKYGAIAAGNAVMEIPETAIIDSRNCYRIVSTANSNDFVSVFYKVRDSVQTYLDVPGLFPRMFTKQLREGKYKNDKLTLFDQRHHLAITGKDSIPTFAFVQDPLSSLYYIRTQELIPGKDVMIDSHTDRKNYPIKIRVLKRERIEVPAGKFDCIVIEPVMRSEGIFKAKGNIKIWLTDDQYKMPVMMKSEVYFLGSINAQLSKYNHGKIGDEQVQKD